MNVPEPANETLTGDKLHPKPANAATVMPATWKFIAPGVVGLPPLGADVPAPKVRDPPVRLVDADE